jgi:pyridoxine kinase
MNNRIPRVAAIHDLSCFGRCALTVIIPTLSAMGIQVVPIPTALLSTHTGGFENMAFTDLSDKMTDIAKHFDELGLEFDAIYTGFLGDSSQIEIVSDFIDRFGGKDCIVFVDPVMGDDGVLYSTYTDELVSGMAKLCAKADIITPNLTEACFLTGRSYVDSFANESDAENAALIIREKLRKVTDAEVCITGIHYGDNMVATYASHSERSLFYGAKHIGRSYPGTGDLFASVMLGKLIGGNSFEVSARKASKFTRNVIKYSEEFGDSVRNGVVLEPMLKKI